MYDYHSHTTFSADGSSSMMDMAQAAVNAGLLELAITDHFDPDSPDPNWPTDLDFKGYHRSLELVAQEFQGKLKLVKGLEIGIQHGSTIKKCNQTVDAYPYDFIIGSFHCAEGLELSQGGFFDDRSVEAATEAFYRYNYQCLTEYDGFDVLGHINIVDRYGAYIPSATCCLSTIEEVLKLLISKGKGIELNTSSFRYGMGNHTTPTKEILELYRRLGGELITVGSDAHHARHVGSGLDWAYDALKSQGYRYITTFDHRKPTFIKL